MSHKSVLLKEIISGLKVSDNEIFVDGTLGNAGHTRAILDTGVENLTVVGIDTDNTAISVATEVLQPYTSRHRILFETTYFDSLKEVLNKYSIQSIDKILFDLGFRSDQVDLAERGFSFIKKGPLDMAFDPNSSLKADEIVNEWQEDTLTDILYGFGEEKFSRRIAKAIIARREEKRIETTTELAEVVKEAVPNFYRRSKIHPATKTFQAIRIAVNSELERLKRVLPLAFSKLNTGGRIAVISFHSLEDRIVKNFFREQVKNGDAVYVNKKPIMATKEEVEDNPRARSAKLRIIQKND